jgi:dTDP-4-dehydrorhamnose reductase
LLGQYLIASAPAGAEIVALSRDSSRLPAAGIARAVDIDFRDSENLAVLLADISPDVIIHTAAEGSVDAVQGNSADFQDINVKVGADLARWCRDVGAHLTFVSSNAVFGGSSTVYSDYSPLQSVND